MYSDRIAFAMLVNIHIIGSTLAFIRSESKAEGGLSHGSGGRLPQASLHSLSCVEMHLCL